MTHKHTHHPKEGAARADGAESTAPNAQAGQEASPGADAAAPAEAPAGAPAAAPPALDEMEKLRAEKDDLLKRLQRVSADYLNYQKRIQKEVAQSREFANEALLQAILPALDDLDRAIEAAEAAHGPDEGLLAGTRLVRQKAMEALEPFGLARFESLGKAFDPDRHMAVLREPTAEHPPGIVLKELRNGYVLKGRVLRPATVVVSAKPEPEKEEETE